MKLICDNIICDKPNINGRIYPKEVIDKMIIDAKEKITNGTLLVTIDSNTNSKDWKVVDMRDTAGTISDIYLTDENKIAVEIDVYPHGFKSDLLRIIPQDNLSITPIGIGTVNENNEIVEDYKLIYFETYLKE